MRTGNTLAALALVLADDIRHVVSNNIGLGGEAVSALITLGANRGLSVGELARGLHLTHSGTVRVIDRLEERGLVRRGGGQDGRTVLLHLTAEGAALRQQALASRQTLLDKALEPLSAEERGALGLILDKIIRTLMKPGEDYYFCRMCDENQCVPFGCPVEQRVLELQR